MRGGAIRSWPGAWGYRFRVRPTPLSSSLRKWPQFQSSFRCSLTTWGGGAQPIIQRFPSLSITRDGVTPRGAFAESQAVFLNPDPDEVIDLDRKLKKCNMGLVAHYYMDAELQGVLSSLKWQHVMIADSLKMGDAAVEMADKGVKYIACMGVDFMAESVRAALDVTGHKNIPVYRLSNKEIGCSLAESAEKMAYEAWLRKAARSKASPNLHVVYINTSLVSKAMAESIIPTITCTSSNVLQTVLQAFAQIPDLTIWYGPDTYMGENLETMLRGMCEGMTDSDIRAVHSQHDRSTISKILDSGRFQYFKQGLCIVHHMFGAEVVSQLRRNYGDAFHLAHLEVPGEMFSLALESSHESRGVVGSTSSILNFIMNKTETIEEGKHAQFVLGTESGMVTSIVRSVQEKLKARSSTQQSSPEVEIVFPVASEAMSIADGGTGPLATVPGVSGGEGCSTAGGCATCPFMKMNDLQSLLDLLGRIADGRENDELAGFLPKRRAFTLDGKDQRELGTIPIIRMRRFMEQKHLSDELERDILSRGGK